MPRMTFNLLIDVSMKIVAAVATNGLFSSQGQGAVCVLSGNKWETGHLVTETLMTAQKR